jgi:hypothetical protein
MCSFKGCTSLEFLQLYKSMNLGNPHMLAISLGLYNPPIDTDTTEKINIERELSAYIN